ncbi:MAG: hypothetical protein AVDCRST_MAG57-3969, partial [uncultured Blastococcus sp.]
DHRATASLHHRAGPDGRLPRLVPRRPPGSGAVRLPGALRARRPRARDLQLGGGLRRRRGRLHRGGGDVQRLPRAGGSVRGFSLLHLVDGAVLRRGLPRHL